MKDLMTLVMQYISMAKECIKENKTISENTISNLKAVLDEIDNQYYNNGKSLIPDPMYDELKDIYLKWKGISEYDYVPGDVTSSKTVKHDRKILSLKKVKTEEELRKEIEVLMPCMAQPKFDGITIVIYPQRNGYIATTRGNGYEGDDITDSIVASKKIDASAIANLTAPVRGEIYIKKSVFAELNKFREDSFETPYENTRNAVAGIIKKGNQEELKYISIVLYNILDDNMSESEQLNTLYNLKLPVPDPTLCKKCNGPDEVDMLVNYIINFDRSTLDYDIDGMVIKANYRNSLKLCGSTEHHPKNAVAYKFKSQGEWTQLIGISWSTGRTGRITPVGNIRPIKVLGSTISKVTLNNVGYMKAKGLKLGKEVYVIKSNDVIPAIIDSREPSIGNSTDYCIPDKCPVCGGEVHLIDDILYCTNNSCNAKLACQIEHYASRDALDIEGLASTTINKMIDAGFINAPTDIFSVTIDQIQSLDGFAKNSANKLYKAIQNSIENVPLDKFIYAAGIPNVGKKASRDIAEKHLNITNLIMDIKDNCRIISTIKDIGQTTVESILSNCKKIYELFMIINPIEMNIKTHNSTNMFDKKINICVTGTLMSGSRKAFAQKAESMGFTFNDRVTNSTDILVVGDKVGQKKIQDATKKGIKIMSEEEFNTYCSMV